MDQADSVHSTPPTKTSPTSPYFTGAEHFTDLETPMRELAAMVDVMMTVWRYPELGNGKHTYRMDVVLVKLELTVHAMVDDYRAKLEEAVVQS